MGGRIRTWLVLLGFLALLSFLATTLATSLTLGMLWCTGHQPESWTWLTLGNGAVSALLMTWYFAVPIWKSLRQEEDP